MYIRNCLIEEKKRPEEIKSSETEHYFSYSVIGYLEFFNTDSVYATKIERGRSQYSQQTSLTSVN